MKEIASNLVFQLTGERKNSDIEIATSYLKEATEPYKREITIKNESLHRKNLALDALHYVWCDGGCSKGVHRWQEEPLTEEIVRTAEMLVARLSRWWGNKESREQWNSMTPEQRKDWLIKERVPFESENPVIKTCENCHRKVNIKTEKGHAVYCDYVWGRRGWRQLGAYDG